MKSFTPILLVFLFLFSCGQEFVPEDTEDENLVSEEAFNTDDYIIYQLDSTIGKMPLPIYQEEIQLDLNGDSIPDLKVFREHDYSPGGISWQFSEVKAVNKYLKLALKDITDTTLFCTTTEVADGDTLQYSWYYNSRSKLKFNNSSDLSVRSIDTIASLNEQYQLDSIKKLTYTKPHTEIEIAYQLQTVSFPIKEEDIVIGYSKYITERGRLNDREFYLLFELSKNGLTQHGWVKIKLYDFDTVTVVEYAIERLD